MKASGTYEELLPCGGKVQVSKVSWKIVYYFPGSDLRYNGDLVTIPSDTVRQYIQAFNENWNEYLKLKETIPRGGEFNKSGKMGMSIRIGGFAEGVCLLSYHMPISTKAKLDQVVKGYEYALERAPQIQRFLADL